MAAMDSTPSSTFLHKNKSLSNTKLAEHSTYTTKTHNTYSKSMFAGTAAAISTKLELPQPAPPRKRVKRTRGELKNPDLRQYRQEKLGIHHELSSEQRIGKSDEPKDASALARPSTNALLPPLPTPTQLQLSGFGQISPTHTFCQEASFETILICLFKSKYLDTEAESQLRSTHPLIEHLAKMMVELRDWNFRELQKYNTAWQEQEAIPTMRAMNFLACLIHYDGRVSNVIRYVGNNYTGIYRNIDERVKLIRGLVDDDLLERYIKLMTTGAPMKFNAESTRANAELHRQHGNHPSITQKRAQVQKTMNKEERNCFVIPIPSWIARFLPNIFYTPQHILEKPGKKDRQVFDGSRRFTPTSIPVNMMTSTHEPGLELECLFGDTFTKILDRIWNLRGSQPGRHIGIHANDVKSCFRQIKHHPDVAGAFSYIIDEYLFVQCGLTFGSDFSPSAWEPLRRMAEQMAEKLFDDDTLVEKHRKYLDKLQWSKRLSEPATELVSAQLCAIHKGVEDENGRLQNTPHFFFVDDGCVVEYFDIPRFERAAAASIETIFRLLGESDLLLRQDPVSWDKFEEMIVHYANVLLGHHINTAKMIVSVPHPYLADLNNQLKHWHAQRKSFTVPEIEPLIGKLGNAAITLPWLRHLMGQLYASLAAALGKNKQHLLQSSKSFQNLLKMIKKDPATEEEALKSSYAIAQTASAPHRSRTRFILLPTAKEELRIIREALLDPSIQKFAPIAHLIRKTDNAECFGDASLLGMGGWSTDMGFWWYVEWPEEIRNNTLMTLKDNATGKLISINVMEYATELINYAASYHYWVTQKNAEKQGIKYPTIKIWADNKTAISWLDKGCKRSLIGRALGRLQCALLMNSPVGLSADYINTKLNVIADEISRVIKEANLNIAISDLYQRFPSLGNCRRFHPNPDLISFITDALLSKRLIDPLTIKDLVQQNPGKIVGSSIAMNRN